MRSVTNKHHDDDDAIAAAKECATTTFLPIYLDADQWIHPEEVILEETTVRYVLKNVHIEFARKELQARNVTFLPRDGITKLRNQIKADEYQHVDEDMRDTYGFVPRYETVAAWNALNIPPFKIITKT